MHIPKINSTNRINRKTPNIFNGNSGMVSVTPCKRFTMKSKRIEANCISYSLTKYYFAWYCGMYNNLFAVLTLIILFLALSFHVFLSKYIMCIRIGTIQVEPILQYIYGQIYLWHISHQKNCTWHINCICVGKLYHTNCYRATVQ